jgi:Zn-dependent peptidase ImmA (M78 family)
MKVLRDPLGRPINRLYFKAEELDARCERKIADFMDGHRGGFRLPIPTDDLIRLIEMDTDDLDMYADLPEEEDGHTDFFADRKPRVMIAKRLSDPRYENRLRMTLGHEYGHVWFHAPLWRISGFDTDDGPAKPRWTCHRDRIVDAPQSDWMEFQAAYIGGALLMPSYSVKLWAGEIAMREAKQPPVPEGSDLGRAMIERLIRRCRVSEQAARVRLLRLGLVVEP